jgi:CheY-like chemotaxis protein
MNPQFNFTNPQLATREILFVGFDRQFSAHILHYPFENDAYSAFQTQDPLQAFSWLNERVDSLETYQLPFAVFFHLDWLERNRFRLIQHLKMHPDLSNVPFIALSESDKTVKIAELLQHGIDDCYQIPVAWDRLEQRLEFLNQYKSALLERSANFKPEALGLRQAPGKRLFDVLAASFGLMMTAPVWLLIAAAIKLESKGPVFYKSKRAGTGYKVFDFIKFRSMYSDAERRLNELKNRNQIVRRPPCDQSREIYPKIQPRRIAATAQHPARRHVACRQPPASALRSRPAYAGRMVRPLLGPRRPDRALAGDQTRKVGNEHRRAHRLGY